MWFEKILQVNGAAPQPWQQRVDFLLLGSDMGAANTVQHWDRDQYQWKRCGFTALR